MEDLIRLKKLSKHYGQQKALDKVSFTLYQGEILGLVGQNGAGKTTLIRLLAGLIKPSAGQITQVKPYRIGAIIETPVLYPNLSAWDNLMYAALQMGIEDAEQRLKDALKLVGLMAVPLKKKVKDFSLGMRQRLAIALAILDYPDLLILDEPINGLDPSGIKEMRAIIHKLRDTYGITILISSHLLSELELVVDRFVIMDKGRLIKDITKDALKAEVAEQIVLATTDNELAQQVLQEQGLEVISSGTQLTLSPTQSVQSVITLLNGHLIDITAIYQTGTSFEDYYLKLLD